jgi:hemerythrin
MNIITWDESLSLENEQVDKQHQRIFALVNDLVGACAEGSSTEKVKEALDFMVDYAIQHFADEEALQNECNYPKYEAHKKLHEDFKAKVGELVKRFEEGGSSYELSDELNGFLIRWLVNHIQKEDKKIADFIK